MSQIDRCFDILELFFNNPQGLPLSKVSSKTGIPLATAHRMLSFIKNRGYLIQDARDDYHLSLLLPSMGKNFIAGTGFAALLQPHLDRLAGLTGEHIRLSAVVDGQLIWVLRAVVNSHGLQYRGALETKIVPHVTASGKIWLSTLKDEEAVRIVSQWNIEQARDYGGPNSITTIKGLLNELEKIRKDKYAMVIEEAEIGVCAAAVGVYDISAENQLLGTLSIAGPTARLNKKGLKSKIPDLRNSANLIQEGWNLWASSNSGNIDPGQ